MVMAAFVAAMTIAPAFAATAPSPVAQIDLNAPVESGSQCMPCHADLSKTQTPGLIFQHGSHMTLSCDACHWAPPHTGGASVLPPMQACFNCHGLQHHGVQIARSDCGLCHTAPRSQLMPASHVAGYAGLSARRRREGRHQRVSDVPHRGVL